MRTPTKLATDEEILANRACLRRLARQLVSADAAADLEQETWTAAFAHRPETDRPVRIWLMEVMRNFARMSRRRAAVVAARRDDVIETATPEAPAAADQLLERLGTSRALVDELSQLPEPYRSTVLLRYYEDRSAADIARLQGVPAGTVRWRLKQGLDLLRARLDARFGGSRRSWLAALTPIAEIGRGGGITSGVLQGGLTLAAKTKVATGLAVIIALLAGAALLVRQRHRPSLVRLEATAAGHAPRPWAFARESFDPERDSGASRPGALAVELVDVDDRPVGGGSLSLSKRLGPAGVELSDIPRPVAIGVSDRDGRARFDGLAPGSYTITAASDRPGMASRSQEGIAVESGQTRPIKLQLGREGLVLSGRVLDSTSGVLSAARVSAQLTERDGEVGAAPQLFAVTSTDDGRYTLVLPPGRYTLRAEADGYAVRIDYVVLGAAVTRDLVMEPGAVLAGRVVDRASRQVVGAANVQARLVEGMRAGRSRPVASDDSGAFRLTGLGPGDYVVDVGSGARAGRSRVVRLGPGQAREDVLVELDGGHRMLGQVVDARGRAVGRATVLLSHSGGAGPVATVSDAGGAFHFDGQLPGRYELTARTADGQRGRQPAIVADTDVAGLTLRLEPEVVVEGRVVDASGAAVANARVAVFADPFGTAGGPRPMAAATSTDDGKFRFTGLERGLVGVRAEHARAGTGTWGAEMLEWGARREVTVHLAARASLAGVVRFDDGRVAPGAVVYAESPNQRERSTMRAVAGADGRYLLTGLNPGPHRVTASREGGHARFRPDVAWTPIAENEQKQLDLVVPRRERIRGSVLLPDGTPAPGAVVIAGIGDYKPLTGSALRAMADDRGRFTIDDLDQDVIYTLWADLAGFSEAKLRGILAGNQDVVLDLLPEAGIAGVVVDRQGRAVTDFELVCAQTQLPADAFTTPTRRLSEAVHHPLGAFEVRPLSPGAYRLEARAPDGRMGDASVRLSSGEVRRDVRITLGGLMTVRGTVVDDATAAPLAGVAINVPSAEGGAPLRDGRPAVVTDAGGHFEFTDVPYTRTLALAFQITDPSYLLEVEYVLVPPSADRLDVGPIRLVRGNLKDRIGSGKRGMIGIEFARQGSDVVLTQIRPNTPAERARLRVGDSADLRRRSLVGRPRAHGSQLRGRRTGRQAHHPGGPERRRLTAAGDPGPRRVRPQRQVARTP